MKAITTAVFSYGLRQPIYKFVPRGLKLLCLEVRKLEICSKTALLHRSA